MLCLSFLWAPYKMDTSDRKMLHLACKKNPKACGGMGSPAPPRALAMTSITLRTYFRQQKQMHLVTQLAYKVFDTFSSAFSQFFPVLFSFFFSLWFDIHLVLQVIGRKVNCCHRTFQFGGDNLQQSEGIFLFFLFPTSRPPHHPPSSF